MLPRGAVAASVRSLTPYGDEQPCQVRELDRQGHRVEIAFIADLRARGQAPLLVYCGSQELATPQYPVPRGFSLREGRDYYHLENRRLRVELDKKSGRVAALIPVGGSGRNQLGEFFPYARGDGNVGFWGGTAKVTEDGPIRKTLSYEHPGMRTELSLYRGSCVLYYRLVPSSPCAISSMAIWTPQGDCRHDRLYYETAEEYYLQRPGVKRAQIRHVSSDDLKTFELPDLKEGRLAFEDERGEVAGDLFQLKRGRPPSLLQHGTGDQIRRSVPRAREHRGALIAARGNYKIVRSAYLSWVNPPVVTLGYPQRRASLRPKVPIFGEDFIRMHYGSYGARYGFRRRNERSAEELVWYVSRLGANCFGFSAAKPFWHLKMITADGKALDAYREDPFITKELIPAAHRHGLAVEVGPSEKGAPSSVGRSSLKALARLPRRGPI